MGRYAFAYYDRLSSLCYTASSYAISMLLLSQVVYINEHSILGATLTLVALVALAFQIVMTGVEKWYLDGQKLNRLERLFNIHFWVNQVFLVCYIGLMLWVAVVMYQRATAT